MHDVAALFDFAGSGPASLPQSAQTMVRLQGVSKRFGALAALEAISLDVKRGEVLGIIGRSGAGKSTLIRCLNGLEKPDAGCIEILGEDIVPLGERELRRMRSRIGMIFQHFNLLSAKTVASNVALPLKIAGKPRSERRARVEGLLQLVGLEDKADAYPAHLSGGQKQRVGIARALAADPALLLSDEATSALDPETTASILALLRDINRTFGLTIVLITHEMNVIRAIADRVAVLDQGRIVEEGATSQVFARPRAELTQRLLVSVDRGADGSWIAGLAAAWVPGYSAYFRLVLDDALAHAPVLIDMASATGLHPIVIEAASRRDGDRHRRTIVFAIRGITPDGETSMQSYLADRGAPLEVLGYAQHPA